MSQESNQTAIAPRVLVNDYVAVKQCRYGWMMYNLNDLFVSRALDLYGEWCNAEMDCLGQLLRPGDVVLDVGANIGTHAVFFAQKVGNAGLVYALEPQRVSYEFLCGNIALNRLLNVIPLQVAVGERAGQIMIPLLNPAVPQNFAALQIEGHTQGDHVQLIPIDELHLKRCNMIKIDVEGMEQQVLRGAKQTIRAFHPFLFVENNTREGSPETVQWIFEQDYDAYWHIANYYNPDNFFQNAKDVFSNLIPESNMICVPKSLELTVNGYQKVTDPTDTWVKAVQRMSLMPKAA